MGEIDKTQVTSSIRGAIEDSPKKSKRVLLKTLLKMFGHKTRQRHWLEAMDKYLKEDGIFISPTLVEAERDEWIVLSVTDPQLPIGNIFEDQENPDGSTPDTWLTT